MVHSKPAQIIDAPELAEAISDIFQPSLCYQPRRQANYDLITVVVDRLKKMLCIEPRAEVFINLVIRHPASPTQLPATELSLHLQVLIPPGTTFELNCGYHLRVFNENI